MDNFRFFRKVERQTETGWETIQFKDLNKGDRFKLYDDPDAENSFEDGSKVYIASSDVYPCPPPEGNYGIEFIPAETAVLA
jgi:hypothetical protein